MPYRSQFQGAAAGFKVLAAAYVGPGDVVASATAWWGLRAYSAATIGSNAIRLRRDSDNAESDFVTVTGGGLDLNTPGTGILDWAAGANLFVAKLYDQTGSALDMIQTTSANQPKFLLSGLGSLPIMQLDSVNSQFLEVASITQSQPLTISAVAERTGNITVVGIWSTITSNLNAGFRTANLASIYAGGAATAEASATDNVWHALQYVFNGNTNSEINVDGSSTNAPNIGTNGPSAHPARIGYESGFGHYLTGNVTEVGLWAGAFNSTQESAMSTNQHGYWGF